MVILPSIRRKYMVGRIPKGATVPMSECVVTLATDSITYTGSARTVGVMVTWDGATLAVNTDYTLAYANNTNIGPATVTVTGMGQFSGSLTKTFYIVAGSEAPWSFDIDDATSVGSTSISTNGGFVLPLVENYDSGNAILPVHRGVNNAWLVGYSLPRDSGDELHLSSLASSYSIIDGDGCGGNFFHPFYFDKLRSGWYSNDSSVVLKMKDGSSFDFSGYRTNSYYGMFPCFANGGRMIFLFDAYMKIMSFSLGTPYDLSTVDTTSAKTVEHFLGISNSEHCICCIFSPDGMQALVGTSWNNRLYHVSLESPYDFSGATSLGYKAIPAYSLYVANEGNTLFVGTSSSITEYNLAAA